MKNKFLENGDKKDCNGCGICTIGCPTNAIKMVEDNEGFYYPEIDETKCIKCNKCKNICSNYNNSDGLGKAYMAISNNKEELKNTSSGGMYYILAKYVIQKNGVVFGVEYGQDLKVQHNYYENLKDCKKFQGSKYLRSNIGNSYEKVKEFLEQNRWVLFTGTPCQCNALKVFLGKDYEKLILCEIICHANPSQKVFDKYIKEIEEKYNKKIVDVKFRTKENGWKSSMPILYFSDGSKIEDKIFYLSFVGELFDRPSCHSCQFSSTNRISDFTIGDFWGVKEVIPDIIDDDTGNSLITVNTEKGMKIFDEIKHNMTYKEVDKELAFSYNHHSNVPMHKNRQKFFDNLDKMPVIENMQKCMKVSIIRKVLRKSKNIAKKLIKS